MASWLTDQEQADLAYYQHLMYQAKLNGDAPALITIAQQASTYLATLDTVVQQRHQTQTVKQIGKGSLKLLASFAYDSLTHLFSKTAHITRKVRRKLKPRFRPFQQDPGGGPMLNKGITTAVATTLLLLLFGLIVNAPSSSDYNLCDRVNLPAAFCDDTSGLPNRYDGNLLPPAIRQAFCPLAPLSCTLVYHMDDAYPLPLDRANEATPTPDDCYPRGEFTQSGDAIVIDGIVIPDGTAMSLDDAAEIVDKWMGCPPWLPYPNNGVLHTYEFSVDDGLIHRVRMTTSETEAAHPHFNLETGLWDVRYGSITPRFSVVNNLHLYYTEP